MREEHILRKKNLDHVELFYENPHGILDGDPQEPGFYLSTLWSPANYGAAGLNAARQLVTARNAEEMQHFSALVIPLPGTSLVLWTVRNITEYKKALETMTAQQLELEKLTYVDHLTQVYNRAALDERLELEYKRWKRYGYNLGIAIIDIDHLL